MRRSFSNRRPQTIWCQPRKVKETRGQAVICKDEPQCRQRKCARILNRIFSRVSNCQISDQSIVDILVSVIAQKRLGAQ